MSKFKFFFFACFIAFLACSCSDKVAGTTEDENTLAQGDSSSSTEDALSSKEDALSSMLEVSSSSIYAIIQPDSLGSETTNSINDLIFDSPSFGGDGNWGGLGGQGTCLDSAEVAQAIENTITLGKFISGRTEKLIATGLTQEQASATAQQELFTALGIDTFLQEQPTQKKYISNLLNYIFGGTTESEFYKSVEKTFTETGTLSKEHYCNFAEREETSADKIPITGYTGIGFPRHLIYEYTMYNSRSCKGTLLIPSRIIEVVNTKCYDMPPCDSSNIGTTVKAKYKSAEKFFTCRASGWDGANAMEATTFGIECDKEGKDVFYGGKPINISFVCSLDSGWHVAETIDAETFDVPCDKHGKLYTSMDTPNTTYVCRKEPFCRHYDFYKADAPCMDEGWDYATKNDLEMSKAECTADGQIQKSNIDPNMYYVCQDGNWSEFYNRPCDTDNKRIKIQDQNITGYVEYICYNKTWRPAYEWHAEYPAEYYFNTEINYGSFKDPRDNYVYHTIDFKGRTWIAENMKYAGFPDSVLAKETRCLEDSCKNVGRFYSYNVADKVCPEGWSLPDSSDIATLGERQPDTPHLISQLGGTGSSYSAPDTYGLSFILSGRIVNTDQPYSPWQGYTAMFWTNETDPQDSRLVVKVGYYKVEYDGWYQNNPPGMPGLYNDDVFLTLRCLKK